MQSTLFEIWCLVLGIWAWGRFRQHALQGPGKVHEIGGTTIGGNGFVAADGKEELVGRIRHRRDAFVPRQPVSKAGLNR